jgi:superfamily II DNA or RNA helicase
MKPEVYILQTDIPLNSNPMIPWANKINELTERPEYLDLVTSIAERFADLGHSVLVVSDRTEFLKKCVEKSGDRAAMIIGNTVNRDKLHEELKGKERDILYGSISIYKEGISESYLSCLVLGTPVNNDPLLEQLIGRILRLLEGKLTPVIVDIVLTGSTSKKQARSRAMLYMRNGYKVTHIDLR